MTEKVYSQTNEGYMDYDSLMDELRDWYAPGETLEVYEGVAVRYEHKQFVNIDRFIDDMMDSAYDEAGEYADNYLMNLSARDNNDLEQLIVNFLDERIGKPEFYTVTGVREVEITVDD